MTRKGATLHSVVLTIEFCEHGEYYVTVVGDIDAPPEDHWVMSSIQRAALADKAALTAWEAFSWGCFRALQRKVNISDTAGSA